MTKINKIILLLLFSVNCYALNVPTLSGRVVDNAQMLDSNTKQQIESILINHENKTTDQVALLTIPSLEGDSLEDFSIRVVNEWKLGKKGKDNGVLLLISRDDRDIRIEVGYGLEGVLTDAQSNRIIRNVIAPRFKNGNFNEGLLFGIQAIVSVVSNEEISQNIEIKNPKNVRANRKGELTLGKLIFFIILFIIFGRRRRRRGILGGWYGGGGGFGGGGFSGGGGGFGGGGSSGKW
jgi:uncharacterized protein